jgi:hypothetical protein
MTGHSSPQLRIARDLALRMLGRQSHCEMIISIALMAVKNSVMTMLC